MNLSRTYGEGVEKNLILQFLTIFFFFSKLKHIRKKYIFLLKSWEHLELEFFFLLMFPSSIWKFQLFSFFFWSCPLVAVPYWLLTGWTCKFRHWKDYQFIQCLFETKPSPSQHQEACLPPGLYTCWAEQTIFQFPSEKFWKLNPVSRENKNKMDFWKFYTIIRKILLAHFTKNPLRSLK